MSATKPKKIRWGECDACGDKGQLWPSKPRVFCCGRVHCRAILFWDKERWTDAWAMAQSRLRVGVELNDLDHHARRVVRGREVAPRAVLPKPKPQKRGGKGSGKSKVKSAKAIAKARESKML